MSSVSFVKYWSDFVSLIYPRTCAGCGSDALNSEQILCWYCMDELPFTAFEKQRNNLVENIFSGRISVQMASSFLYFGKESLVQRLIHQVKYKNNKELGVLLGRMMGKAMVDAGWADTIDIIIPLPLNKRKEIKRGFNQAALLATGIGEMMNKSVNTTALIRTKFTETQTRKGRQERWENVDDVFNLKDNYIFQNKHVLLVDDVVTTGATLEAGGQALLKMPGLKLSIATLAFASKI